MRKKFRIGDKVKVVGMWPVTFAPGVMDELGIEKLYKNKLEPKRVSRRMRRAGALRKGLQVPSQCRYSLLIGFFAV